MTTYRTLHTTYGLQRIAQAVVTGIALNLTHMAVGDGDGNPVEPTEDQTQLVREQHRAAINRVFHDPVNQLKFTAELIVPSDVGGFTIREVGIFDSNGNLFAVANTPPAYKPTYSEGAFSDGVYRMEFMVTNASIVTIQADPAVSVATQLWVINNITAGTLIPGGTTGQTIIKSSNADGDMEWSNPDTVNVVVDTIEEAQTLAAAQTVVDLAVTTTRGLALYISGTRLRRDQWTADPDINTRLSLAVSYPVGTRLICAQNEPTGSAPAPLESSKNFSDVSDIATARKNLDIYSKAETERMAPAGNIAYSARSTAPAGWLKANGTAISRTVYANLFAAIGTKFGVGDGFNTFNLPDLRGEFLRGWDDGRGADPGRLYASWQQDELKSHMHNTYATYGGALNIPTVQQISEGPPGSSGNEAISTNRVLAAGGTETRPRNIALLAIIKF